MMAGPHGSWNDKHYVYRPTWGSGAAYGEGYDEEYGDTYRADGYGDDTYAADAYGDASYDDHTQAGNGAGDWGAHERERAGVGDSVRGAFGGLAWLYRSAPLWARVTIDVSAAVLVLALLLGGALALRGQGEPDGAEVAPDGTTSTNGDGSGGPLPTGSDAAGPTSSTSTTPGTTRPAKSAPITATTVARTTVATATTVPPTTTRRPPGPPSTGTTTTSTTPAEPHYRNCLEALQAGALPLFEGDPGYSRRLDDDGDGQACEPGEF
jgi:hypothetical protein